MGTYPSHWDGESEEELTEVFLCVANSRVRSTIPKIKAVWGPKQKTLHGGLNLALAKHPSRGDKKSTQDFNSLSWFPLSFQIPTPLLDYYFLILTNA
jgi:hypothetical protein